METHQPTWIFRALDHPMVTSTIACAVAFGCIAIIHIGGRYVRSTRRAGPLPPGPPGLPWIGNVIGFDVNAPWLTYNKWAKTYGDLVHSRLLGKDIIIINSEKIAKDLLDKHSSNNSDRPYLLTNELYGLDFNTAFIAYGERWRLQRRFFRQTMGADAVERFLPFQHRKACQFLRQLFSTSTLFNEHIFEYTTSIVLNSAYDYDPPSHEVKLVKAVARVQETVLSALRPDIAIIISTFPILLKLPGRFPGISLNAEMAIARRFAKYAVEMADGYSSQNRDAPCMLYDALRSMEATGTAPDELWMEALKDASATTFLGGSRPSYSALMSFFLAMALNPEVQEKAQAQIDAVVGKERLPMMDDRPSLPFIDAIFRETLRYLPVAPLSIPHAAMDDDVYCGFHIPKGAILIANVWTMTHDESRFPNPHAFIPERFLNEDGSLKPNDIDHIAYGFGRRICPGRYFADRSVWSLMAKVLAVFKILKPLDENGIEIPIKPKFTNGLAAHPLPFQCRIVPRMSGMKAENLEELIAESTA